jgi:hypothetical protein
MPTIITHDNSVFTTGANVDAFDGNSALASDSLTVNADGFLIASGASADGAVLSTGPVWKVIVNGTVHSQQGVGLHVNSGNQKVSTITIGEEGSVSGATAGLLLLCPTSVVNAGTIAGTTTAIEIGQGGPNTITNTGLITGLNAIIANPSFSVQKVTNSGTIEGLIELGGDADTLTNSGAIENQVLMGFGDDTVTNSGSVKGAVNLGQGVNKLTNSGTIAGGVIGGSNIDTITNTGTITGTINLGDGLNVIKNSGIMSGFTGGIDADTITNSGDVTGSIFLGNGRNVLTNSGTIGGNINGGADVDSVKNTGFVTGFFDLGLGDDIFAGGNLAETLRDNGGSDRAKLGAGNDTYRATRPENALDGTDTIDGGTGVDTYDARFAEAAISVNLDTVAHDFSPFQPGRDVVAANTATGADVADLLKDTIVGFENVIGGSSHDIIHGSAAANVLQGNAGDDFLGGYGGNDVLSGGAGLDTLHGGAGKDTLTGGADIDFFRFVAASESSVGKAGRDVITDFTDGADRIELSFIDAVASTGADDAFRFIGTNVKFSGSAGELRTYWTAEGQIVEGDINGDKKADFAIEILDAAHAIVLTASDFLL